MSAPFTSDALLLAVAILAHGVIVSVAVMRMGSRIGRLVSPLQTISHTIWCLSQDGDRIQNGLPPAGNASRKSPTPDASFKPRDPAGHTIHLTLAVLAGGESSSASTGGE